MDLTQLIAGASGGGGIDFPKGVDRNEPGEGSYLPTIPQSGVTNAGVSYFNAKGNHWAVADTNLFDFGTSAFSFETFVTPTTGIGYQTVAEKDEEWRVSINESKGELTLAVWDASLASNNWVIAQAKLDGTNSFTGSVDYYIGVVATPGASNTAVTLYYQNLTDGGDLLSAERTIAGVTSIHNTTNSFLLNGDTNQRAVRYMDEVRIVTRALGESELLVAAAADPSGFDAFVDKYDLSGDPSANADNDELTDWGEYVFGGNPTNSGDIGTQPSLVSGGYLFSIVGDNTLQYYVLTNTNLVEGGWGTNTGPVAITDESGELGSYTNAVGTADDELFIKLLVE
ncbi:hypothetical protein [Pontiella sulfatireligans]|uniref:Uncharacterized protein n=1 Tax=Pontiella sulfatireligans TaxID=2750658 RepID=A0A6C2UJ44_9BACT|nr:hypothetical protein [Pontiella sulfatireligans]VGO19467.1 hypothetical protein SCARR_01526 [Pontiella sulfatireligans]